MKKLILFGLLYVTMNIQAQENNVELHSRNVSETGNQFEIPVHVNYDYEQLNIHITENIENVSTTIEGPEGIVYQQQITAPKGQSLSVNLQPFQEGEYIIIFQDAKGNEVEGIFTKEEY